MKAFPNLSPREETATSVQVLEEHLHHLTSQCKQWNLWEGGSVCVCVWGGGGIVRSIFMHSWYHPIVSTN